MKLSDIELSELIPRALKDDKFVDALIYAMNKQFQKVADSLVFSSGIIMTSLAPSDMTHEILDQIANDLGILWYDVGATLDIKKALILNSDKMYQTLGTSGAVIQLAKDYFGDGIVEEWPVYGGSAYHYRITTGNRQLGAIQPLFENAIKYVENVRSVLDEIVYTGQSNLDNYTHLQLSAYTHEEIRNGGVI